jgi:hypothetical protein
MRENKVGDREVGKRRKGRERERENEKEGDYGRIDESLDQ